MDTTNRPILQQFQENVVQLVFDSVRKAGQFFTPCWYRIQRVEVSSILRQRVSLLGADNIRDFVAVRTGRHSADPFRHFCKTASAISEGVEFYRMSSEVDYMLRVVVADMANYDAFYRKLSSNVEPTDVCSSFVMEQIKFTTAQPLSGNSTNGGNNAS